MLVVRKQGKDMNKGEIKSSKWCKGFDKISNEYWLKLCFLFFKLFHIFVIITDTFIQHHILAQAETVIIIINYQWTGHILTLRFLKNSHKMENFCLKIKLTIIRDHLYAVKLLSWKWFLNFI